MPGRSGNLIIDNKRYNNVTVPYSLFLLDRGQEGLAALAHNVKAWLLSEVGYFRLWDSYDTCYFRLASYNDGVNIEEELRGIGEFTASFNCKPFKYSFEGQEAVEMTQPETIVNPEYLPSAPYIKIVGNGNITLTINNTSFYFVDIDGYIEVDSDTMNAHKGLESLNNSMKTPTFPEFTPGENTISWVGAVEKLEIVPRWCAL